MGTLETKVECDVCMVTSSMREIRVIADAQATMVDRAISREHVLEGDEITNA